MRGSRASQAARATLAARLAGQLEQPAGLVEVAGVRPAHHVGHGHAARARRPAGAEPVAWPPPRTRRRRRPSRFGPAWPRPASRPSAARRTSPGRPPGATSRPAAAAPRSGSGRRPSTARAASARPRVAAARSSLTDVAITGPRHSSMAGTASPVVLPDWVGPTTSTEWRASVASRPPGSTRAAGTAGRAPAGTIGRRRRPAALGDPARSPSGRHLAHWAPPGHRAPAPGHRGAEPPPAGRRPVVRTRAAVATPARRRPGRIRHPIDAPAGRRRPAAARRRA